MTDHEQFIEDNKEKFDEILNTVNDTAPDFKLNNYENLKLFHDKLKDDNNMIMNIIRITVIATLDTFKNDLLNMVTEELNVFLEKRQKEIVQEIKDTLKNDLLF